MLLGLCLSAWVLDLTFLDMASVSFFPRFRFFTLPSSATSTLSILLNFALHSGQEFCERWGVGA